MVEGGRKVVEGGQKVVEGGRKVVPGPQNCYQQGRSKTLSGGVVMGSTFVPKNCNGRLVG